MTIVGEVQLDIRALDRYFRRDVERAVRGLRNVSIDVIVSADILSAQKSIDSLEKNLNKNPLTVGVEADTNSLESSINSVIDNITAVIDIDANTAPALDTINSFTDSIKENTVKVLVEADTDLLEIGIDDVADKLQDKAIKVGVDIDDSKIQNSVTSLNQLSNLQNLDLKVTADTTIAEATLQNFLNNWGTTEIPLQITADVAQAQSELDQFRKTQEGNSLPIKANAQTAAAEARLAFLARNRNSNIVARVDKTATTVLKGFAEALSGVVPPAQIAKALEAVIGNFSTLAVKAGVATAALGALGAAGTSLVGSLVTIGDDIGDLVGLVALLPAGLLATQMAMKATTYSFENFGSAIQGDEKALAKLTPSARRAAESLVDVIKVMKTRTQESFWQEAADSMEVFAGSVMPRYSENIQGIAKDLGRAFSEMLDAIVDNKNTVDATMRNIGFAFEAASRAAAPFTTAMIVLGRVGAPYLVSLGRAAAFAAKDFETFIISAAKAGDIDRWIEDGLTAMQNLGSIIKSTVVIFGNLASAAEAAGFGGLQALADGLDRIEEASGRAENLARLTNIFEGARIGADALYEGIGVLGDTFMEASEGVGHFLEVAGKIGGLTFKNLDVFLNADGFGSGMIIGIESALVALDSIKPGIQDLGELFGDLAEMAGALFIAMAPGFNNVMRIIATSVANIKDGFIAALPVINQFIDMLTSIGGLIPIAMVTIVGELLELFAMLPGPIQQTMLAVVALNIALKTLGLSTVGVLGIGTALATLGTRAKGVGGIVGGLGTVLGVLAGRGASAASGLAGAGSAAAKAATQTAAARASSQLLGTAVASAAISAGAAGKQFGILGSTAGSFAGGASKSTSALSMLGTAAATAAKKAGVIGAVITVAAGLFNAYEESVGAAKEATLNLNTALDQQGASSGAALQASEDILTSSKTFSIAVGDQIKSLGGLIDVSNTAADGFDQLGWSTEEVASAMNASGGEWTDYRQKLEALYEETGRFGSVSEETSRAILGTADAAGMSGNEIREMINAYDTGNRSIEAHAEAQRAAAEAARAAAKLHSDAVGALEPMGAVASAAADGFKVLGDASASTDEHLRAFRATLDWATDGLMSETSAKMRSAQASADLSGSLDDIVASATASGEAILTANGEFDKGSQAGRDFYFAMEEAAAGIHEVGIEAYNTTLKNTGSIEQASQAALDATSPMVEQVIASLKDMGITGDAEIRKILEVLGLLDEDITLALDVEGDAARDLMAVKLVADGIASGNYDIAIGAVNKNAMATIAETVGAGEAYANDDYMAVFKAMAEDMGAVEAVEFLQKAATMEPEAILTMYAEDYASGKAEEVLKKGDLIDSTTAEMTLEAVDNITVETQRALGSLREIDGKDSEARMGVIDNLSEESRVALQELLKIDSAEPEAILKAIDEATPAVQQAMGVVDEFDLTDPQINLSAVDDSSNKVVGAIDQALEFDGMKVVTTLDALNNLSHEARTALADVLGVDDSSGTALLDAVNDLSPQAAQAVADLAGISQVDSTAVIDAVNNASPEVQYAITEINSFSDLKGQARLDAVDDASHKARTAMAEVLGINSVEGHALLAAYDELTPEAQGALDKVVELDGTNAMAELRAQDGMTPTVDTAGFNLDALMNKPTDKSLTATDNTGTGVSLAQGTMNTLSTVTRGLFGSNQAGTGRNQAQGTLETLTTVTRSLFGRNEAQGGRNNAQSTLETLTTVTRSLFGRNDAQKGRNSAQGTLESLDTVTRSLFGRDEADRGVSSAQRTLNGLKDKTITISANDNASGVIGGAVRALANFVSKTINIHTNETRSGSRMADGGIWTGNGALAFADGGIVKSIQKFANGGFSGSNISKFAGGSENHVAQIARGAWPVRQWAEPETGGEAYIPLALAKRARSLDILELVAKKFGYDLVKQFNNGGIISSVVPQKSRAFADGGFSGRTISSYVGGGSRSGETVVVQGGDTSNRPIIQMTVNPSAPLDEVQVGNYAADQLYWRLMHS